MVYEQFKEYVREQLQHQLGPDHTLTIHSIPKNNGVSLDGISDHSPSNKLAATVYLSPYYHQLETGQMTIAEICNDIARLFANNPPPDSIHADALMDFEQMKPLVMMKLIHAEANRELLQDVPHIPYLDLAIVFYLFLEQRERGQMTALIHQEHLSEWNTDLKTLVRLAAKNTPQLHPARIQSMTSVLKKMAQEELGTTYEDSVISEILSEETDPPLYILTNPSGVYGAACILYKNVLKNFANQLDQDLVIIPSSVHEVLLLPYNEDLDLNEFNSMVHTVNLHEVSVEDRLSNHIYFYSRFEDKIKTTPFQEASL